MENSEDSMQIKHVVESPQEDYETDKKHRKNSSSNQVNNLSHHLLRQTLVEEMCLYNNNNKGSTGMGEVVPL